MADTKVPDADELGGDADTFIWTGTRATARLGLVAVWLSSLLTDSPVWIKGRTVGCFDLLTGAPVRCIGVTRFGAQ